MTGKPTLTPLDKIIGANARRIRERIGATQEEMAEVMGCKPNMLSMLETGKRAWTTKYIYAVCVHYKLNASEFFSDSDEVKLANQMRELLELKSSLDKKKK